jgi:hypothetical protein
MPYVSSIKDWRVLQRARQRYRLLKWVAVLGLTQIEAPVSGFERFVRGDGRGELARIQSELRDRGVFEVPTYLLNDDTFLGRQHLPLIRSCLSARNALPQT